MESFLKSNWENENSTNKAFMNLLRPWLEEFLEVMKKYKVDGLEPKFVRSLEIFRPALSKACQAEATYRLNYDMSFAAYAQAQRHRSIRYSIELYEESKVYVPPIIREANLEQEWVEDMLSVADCFPQGFMINVTETGLIEDFVGKCYERCCGRAQLEIQENTCQSLEYLRTTPNEDVKEYLLKTTGNAFARCGFPGYRCVEPCKFGKTQRERKI
jgi:hypothetical protein